MPQTYETLRKKFMTATDDGIAKAESILRSAGYTVDNGDIKVKSEELILNEYTRGEILDAIDYLCEEWDYAFPESEFGDGEPK